MASSANDQTPTSFTTERRGSAAISIWKFESCSLGKLSFRPPAIADLINSGALQKAEGAGFLVAFQEALANSVEHGNLELPSTWKEEYDQSGVSRFAREKARRLTDEQFCKRLVQVQCSVSSKEIAITITDEGPGFDLALASQGQDLEDPHGRGISLIKRHSDSVDYTSGGRAITLRKKLRKKTT